MTENGAGRQLLRTLLALAGNILLIPTLAFVVIGLQKGMGFSGTGAALIEQYDADRANLLMASVLGLAPILLLCLLLALRRLLLKTWAGARIYVIGAAVPVVLVTVFVQMSYWPKYLPARQFMGFPHSLENVMCSS